MTGDDDQDDDNAFTQAMIGVQPLKRAPTRIPPSPQATATPPRTVHPAGPRFAIEVQGEWVCGRGASTDTRLMKRLGDGDMPVDASIDLHGHTEASATQRLDTFVTNAVMGRKRVLRIIHGRGLRSGGGGIVKDLVLRRVTTAPWAKDVIGFVSAPGRHGGAGALLVVMRREKSAAKR